MPPSGQVGYFSAPVLPFLVGQCLVDPVLAVISTLRPSRIVLVRHEDHDVDPEPMLWQVVVRLAPYERITAIEQVVEAKLPSEPLNLDAHGLSEWIMDTTKTYLKPLDLEEVESELLVGEAACDGESATFDSFE